MEWTGLDINVNKSVTARYQFQTAWSPPEEWLRRTALIYPKLLFVLDFEEEAQNYPNGRFTAQGKEWREDEIENAGDMEADDDECSAVGCKTMVVVAEARFLNGLPLCDKHAYMVDEGVPVRGVKTSKKK